MGWSRFSYALILIVLTSSISVLGIKLSGPIAIVSNDIDMPAAKKLQKALLGMGLDSEIRSPEEYTYSFSWARVVIILGGHKAPQGIGDIVDKLLTQKEKEFLEKPYHGYYFFRRIGKTPVVIIAGSTRAETFEVVDTFVLKGIEELRKFMSSGVAVVVPPY